MKKPYGNHFRVKTPCDSKYPMYDEEMLYYMLCFNFDLRKLINYKRPLHGLHFGTFRRVDSSSSFAVNKNHSDEKTYLPTWKKDIEKIKPILESSLMEFMKTCGSDQFKNTIKKTNHLLLGKYFI